MNLKQQNPIELLELIEAGLDNINQGITIFDKDLKLVFCNCRLADILNLPAHLTQYGVSFEEIIKYNCQRGEYGPGDPEEQLKERLQAARKMIAHTIERTRPDGTVIRISGVPLPLGGFATVYTDITKDRLYELKLETQVDEKTNSLRRSEERLRLIADEVPAGIVYLDQDEVFRFANRRFAKAYNLIPEQVIGRTSRSILSTATYAAVEQYFAEAKQGKRLDFDLHIELANGRMPEVRTYLRPDFDSSGRVNGFYVLSLNVTKHKEAAAALSQAQKMEAIGQLSSGVAHDFNNLLTVIIGNLVPLSDKVEDDSLKQEMIVPVINAAKRGAKLTKQLLAVARRQPFELKAVNVSDLAKNIASLAQASMPDNIHLNLGKVQQNIWALTDLSQMENALLNLILNARDAFDDGGEINVDIDYQDSEQPDSRQVRIVVSDAGCGIDPSVLKKVFDPFFTTKTNSGGSGLGLTMIQSFIEQSNGSIEAFSELGKGSRFVLLLPAASVPEKQAVGIEKRLSSVTQKTTKQGLVMLVDDNYDVRQVVRRQLVSLNHLVVEANDAQEALELLGHIDGIDMLVSDISMPGELSGIELVERIAQEFPHIKTVLMTGHGANQDFYEETHVQCPILRKPFATAKLAAAINDIRSTDSMFNSNE